MKGELNRDRSVEHLLRRSLAAGLQAQVSDSCLDAETLAAWVDGGLDGQAMAMAEAHASACARCQALVGAMARSAPGARAPAPWWRRDWNPRWLVPLTAGAAAVALWMVVPDQPRSLPPVAQVESPARPATPPAAEQSVPERLEARSRAAPEKPVAAPAAAPDEAKAAKPAAESVRRLDDRNVPKRDAQADAKSAGERALQSTPAAPPAAAAPADALGRLAETVTVRETIREILSPDPAIRWRLTPGGVVHYSTNGGSTWELLSTGASAELTAGSSPSPSVCWLVGRGGTILLTTDGRRWTRVPFPEPADLTSVQAVDARTAVVTTTDGRTFRTADAGQTWNPPRLQDFCPAPF